MSSLPAEVPLKGVRIDVLDKGFVRVIDTMGDDSAIVQAARVSYGDGTKSVREDRGLIRYLMRHWHTSPFEMCEIKFHIKAPIFVARQWLRHRMASVNEYSARYSVVRDEFYTPEAGVVARQSSVNHQGRGETLPREDAERIVAEIGGEAARNYDLYESLILEDGGPGVARELARVALPLSTYTEFYWKIDLHNLLHFLRLRADPHAQYEIRVFAEAILDVVKRWVPHTHEAFVDYRLRSVQLSRMEIEAIRQLLRGREVDPKSLGISPREWAVIRDRFLSSSGSSDASSERSGYSAAA